MVNLILKTKTETHVLNCLICVQDLTCLFLQIFLPIVHRPNCYMYCFNLANKRTDYLSCTASKLHKKIAQRYCNSLEKEMHKVEMSAFRKTTRTRTFNVEHNFKGAESDNLLFTIYFMESYNGKRVLRD
jgi:hypothetical protein